MSSATARCDGRWKWFYFSSLVNEELTLASTAFRGKKRNDPSQRVGRTSSSRIFLRPGRNRNLYIAMVLPIQLREMSHDRGIFSRRDIRPSTITHGSFASHAGLDGGFGRVESIIRNVGPARLERRGCREDFDEWHGWYLRSRSTSLRNNNGGY